MKDEEFLRVLKNIYGSLTYDDWFHAKEYVKIEIEKLEKMISSKLNNIYQKNSNFEEEN